MLTVGESLSAKAPKVSHFRLTLCSCSDRCPVVLDWLGVGESAGRSFSTAAPISAAHWSRSSREHASRKYSAELLVCSLNTSWGTVNNKEDQRMMLNSWRLHLNPKMISWWCVFMMRVHDASNSIERCIEHTFENYEKRTVSTMIASSGLRLKLL